MRKIAWVAAALCVVILVIAFFVFPTWRERGGTGVATTVDGQSVYLTENDQLPSVTPKRRYKLGVLYPFLAAPYWVNESYGITDQAAKVGVDVVWLSADGYSNVDKQSSQMEDLVALKVDAILLAATSFDGIVPAVNRAVAAGVPVLTHGTSANTNTLAASVLLDHTSIGRKQAEYLGAALGGTGSIVMLTGPPAVDWTVGRVSGFKQVMKEKYPGIKILAERSGIPDRADAQRLTADLLATFGDVRGIVTVADGMALGALDAVTAVHRSGQILIATASFSRETLPFITSGQIAVNVDESPVITGRMAIIRAVQYLNGEKPPKVTFVPTTPWSKENIAKVNPAVQWAPQGWLLK